MGSFYDNTIALVEAIEDCLDKRRILPCLALLYTGIDVVASLERGQHEGTKASFTRWVEAYLLKARSLRCTALELYAARCGIIHSFTADSDLFQKGKVRQIHYAWGNAKAGDLQDVGRLIGRHQYVAVHVRDLIDAFRHGLAAYVEDVRRDPRRQHAVEKRAGLWFTNVGQGLVKVLLATRSQRDAT